MCYSLAMNDLSDAKDLLSFIQDSPSSWHAAKLAGERLLQAGFSKLEEGAPFPEAPGDAFFFQRGGTLIAVKRGQKPPEEAGFRLLGAHTDSPHLRLKPKAHVERSGYHCLGVEVYGGALHYSWLDRDLGLSGRIFLRSSGPFPKEVLFDYRKPICRVPSLAIHLNRGVNKDGLLLNPQEHLSPMFGLQSEKEPLHVFQNFLGEALDVSPDEILSWDLGLVDVQPPSLGGLKDAFVFAARLDNLGSSHAGLEALMRSRPMDATQVLCLYDHEEVGSQSSIGAHGPLVASTLERLLDSAKPGFLDRKSQAISRSWQVSADMAHAVHPNYESYHEPQHRPILNGGPVIKSNANQRYATDGESAAFFQSLADEAGIPLQYFVTRTDLACGTTIGPISASTLGIRTVDVGNPMLSMHSIREQAGAHDVAPMIVLLTKFLEA